jgi:tetratricopeptide (TPR) repeat protein
MLIKLTETNKNYARAYNGIGVAYKTKKNYDEAIKYYKRAIEINPQYDAPFNGIGIVLYLKG